MILLWEMACEVDDFLEGKYIANRDAWMDKLIAFVEALTTQASFLRSHLDSYADWDMYEETMPKELEQLGELLCDLYTEILTTISKISDPIPAETPTTMEKQQAAELKRVLVKLWDESLSQVSPFKSIEDVHALRPDDLPRYQARWMLWAAEDALSRLLDKTPSISRLLYGETRSNRVPYIDGDELLADADRYRKDFVLFVRKTKQGVYDSLEIIVRSQMAHR